MCSDLDEAAGDGRLRVQTHDCAAAWIVELIGDATAADLTPLSDALARVAEHQPILAVIDLTRARHLSAAAISQLIAFRNQLARRHADTVLAVDCPLIADQLRRLRLHRLFDIQFTVVPGIDPGSADETGVPQHRDGPACGCGLIDR